MSRLDYLTIGIVALCIAALIYLVYRYVNLPHSPTNTTTTEVVDTDRTQFEREDTTGFPAEDTSDKDKPGPGAVVEPEVVPEEKTPVQSKNNKPVVAEPKPVAPPVDNNQRNSKLICGPLHGHRRLLRTSESCSKTTAENSKRRLPQCQG